MGPRLQMRCLLQSCQQTDHIKVEPQKTLTHVLQYITKRKLPIVIECKRIYINGEEGGHEREWKLERLASTIAKTGRAPTKTIVIIVKTRSVLPCLVVSSACLPARAACSTSKADCSTPSLACVAPSFAWSAAILDCSAMFSACLRAESASDMFACFCFRSRRCLIWCD